MIEAIPKIEQESEEVKRMFQELDDQIALKLNSSTQNELLNELQLYREDEDPFEPIGKQNQ